MSMLKTAFQIVFALRTYRWIGAVSFASFLLLYLMTLPSAFTGGRIGPAAMAFLDTTMVIVSVVMSALIASIIPFMVYLIRQGQKASKASAGGGVLVGILTPVLCCSPILPVVMGSVAAVFPSLIGAFGWKIQGFIATHQIELFIFAVLLLVFALYQNAKKVAEGPNCRVDSQQQIAPL